MSFSEDVFSDHACSVIARLSKEVVYEAHAIPHALLLDEPRGDTQTNVARQIAIYLAHVVGQLTQNEVARHFNRSRATVSHSRTNIEDRRDSPIFDLQLAYMEKRLRQRINDFRMGSPSENKSVDTGEIFSRRR